jgi:diaminopropionate ammonia-lyase
MSIELFMNPHFDGAKDYGAVEKAILSVAAGHEALKTIAQWPGYTPTPLRSLKQLAAETGVAAIDYKDEDARFVLKSFKALGGAYAVEKLVRENGGKPLTVTCATDGNHGRAVAWGAQRAGCKAVIFIHEGVSEGRAEAIRSFGAEVRREGKHYDDSVRRAADVAAENNWQIVSDTSWPGYQEVPKSVMQGYALLAAEALAQGTAPTHVFVQGGVGGLAAGVLSWFWEQQGAARPKTIVVEPDRAACLLATAKAGALTNATGDLETIMAGLACGEASQIAWDILEHGTEAFMAIPDDAAADTMRKLATYGIVGGESGVAGLAGFRIAASDPAMRAALGIDEHARILTIGTEGDTDPAVYESIVGMTGAEVRQRRSA